MIGLWCKVWQTLFSYILYIVENEYDYEYFRRIYADDRYLIWYTTEILFIEICLLSDWLKTYLTHFYQHMPLTRTPLYPPTHSPKHQMRLIDYSNLTSSNNNTVTKESDESNFTKSKNTNNIQQRPLLAGSRRVLNSFTDSRTRFSEPGFSKARLNTLSIINSKANISQIRNTRVDSGSSLKPAKKKAELKSMSSINKYIQSNTNNNPEKRFFEDQVDTDGEKKEPKTKKLGKSKANLDQKSKPGIKRSKERSEQKKIKKKRNKGKLTNQATGLKKSVVRKPKKNDKKGKPRPKPKKGGEKKKKPKNKSKNRETKEELLNSDRARDVELESPLEHEDYMKKTRQDLASGLKDKLRGSKFRFSISKEINENNSMTSLRKSLASQNFNKFDGAGSTSKLAQNLTSQANFDDDEQSSITSNVVQKSFSKKDLNFIQVNIVFRIFRT